jgi:hypothetical protein
MANGDVLIGTKSKMAGVKETTFGTPLLVTQKIPFVQETLTADYAQEPDPTLCGVAAPQAPEQGVLNTSGGWTEMWKWTDANLSLERFFGQYNVAGVDPANYTLLDDLDQEGATYAIDKIVDMWVFSGYKPNVLTVSGSPGEGVRLAYDGFATSLAIDPSSPLNNRARLDTLGVFTENNIRFRHLTLLIGDYVDALAAPADRFYVSNFTLTCNRALETDEVNDEFLQEAIANGWRESTLSIAIPRYSNNTFRTWHKNHTDLQATLIFDNGTKTKTIYLPRMKVSQVPVNVDGPGRSPLTVNFTLHPNVSNAFGRFQDVTAELFIEEE